MERHLLGQRSIDRRATIDLHGAKMQPRDLSVTDSKVLTQVFDPESGPVRAEIIVDPALPADKSILDTSILADIRSREKAAIRLIERCETSNDQDPRRRDRAYREALTLLDEIVEEHPGYASARNNRAQLRRWRFGDRNMICRPRDIDISHSEEHSAAIDDLQTAIALASPNRPQDAVSPSQGKLLAQAHTQLAAIYLRASKDFEDVSKVGDDTSLVMGSRFDGWTEDRFEEQASRLFYLGGLYGNEVAKALAVHTNPHAKLCGNIVKEAMRKELGAAGM